MLIITKKESLFLSVYHTVWMLHKAKTARLVITLYQHCTDILPTSYRHLTDTSPTVGRLIVCVLGKTCRSSVGRQTADSRPTVGRQSANRRPTVGQQTTDSRPTGFLGSYSSQLPCDARLTVQKWLPSMWSKSSPIKFLCGIKNSHGRKIWRSLHASLKDRKADNWKEMFDAWIFPLFAV